MTDSFIYFLLHDDAHFSLANLIIHFEFDSIQFKNQIKVRFEFKLIHVAAKRLLISRNFHVVRRMTRLQKHIHEHIEAISLR
jgi:hypothetical protein